MNRSIGVRTPYLVINFFPLASPLAFPREADPQNQTNPIRSLKRHDDGGADYLPFSDLHGPIFPNV
jgi:hypothetical protein